MRIFKALFDASISLQWIIIIAGWKLSFHHNPSKPDKNLISYKFPTQLYQFMKITWESLMWKNSLIVISFLLMLQNWSNLKIRIVEKVVLIRYTYSRKYRCLSKNRKYRRNLWKHYYVNLWVVRIWSIYCTSIHTRTHTSMIWYECQFGAHSISLEALPWVKHTCI